MSDDLRISEAALLIGVHENTVRNAIKKGALRATMKPGPWGREQYAIHPKVFAEWVLERYGRALGDEELAPDPSPVAAPTAPQPELMELYERLIAAESTASRCLAIEAATEDIKGLYEQRVDELRSQVSSLEEQLELARRPWYVRLFK